MPVGAMQTACAALIGLLSLCSLTQGSGARYRGRLHPGLCCSAPSALEFVMATPVMPQTESWLREAGVGPVSEVPKVLECGWRG